MEEAKEFVTGKINSKPVVVFSKTYCPFCVKVINLFQNDLKIPSDKLEILQIENDPNCSAYQQVLKEITGASSVPRVFIAGEFIGGCDDTLKMLETGKLKKLLDAAL